MKIGITLEDRTDISHGGTPRHIGYTAHFSGGTPDDVRGCPLGRGETREGAIRDLLNRANAESGTSYGVDDVEIDTDRTRETREKAEKQSVKMTGDHKTLEQFKDRKVGDTVCQKTYDHLLNVLFPACMDPGLLQMGEAMDHNAEGKPRFLTLQRHGEKWVFTGRQTHRTRVKIEA